MKTPAGAELTLELAEHFTVKDGRISKHHYDPREFAKAFGMQ